MSEDLGNTIFRDAGIPATRVTYARVWINERDMGVYVLKEGFADAFLKRFFEDPGGTVYEGAYSDIDGNVTPRVNKAAAKPERIKTLIEACRQSDPSARREKLGRILDIDRFLTLMAVETMTAHWDGYCPNVNNYRVYDDPKPHRLVFLPHGTDQLFQQSGFPLIANRGIVARALTDTLEDRATYLERVAEVRKKVFTPELLGRRLDEVAARLAPAMADVGADALRRHKEQTDDLRRRIEERIRNIDQQLASTPKPLKFNSSGVAVLTDPHWQQRTEGGNATLDVADEATHPRLHIRATGDCVASFRTTATLPKGSYVFEGSCKTAGVVAADGQNSGAGLRISGGRRDARLVGDNDWQPVRFEFDVDGARDVVLVCELRATAGEAWFDAGAFKLRRR
jgi:hypothetical protein